MKNLKTHKVVLITSKQSNQLQNYHHDKATNFNEKGDKTSMEDYLQCYRRDILWRRFFFPEYFIRHCKRNATIPQNIPNEIRNKIKKLALEAGLYS